MDSNSIERSKFGFENLDVWQKAVDFCVKVIDLTEQIDTPRKHYRLVEQLEAASASISANIAEGKGRYSKKEFIQFLYIARGSLFESITFMTIFFKKSWITEKQLTEIKNFSEEIGKMLSGLISSIKRSMP